VWAGSKKNSSPRISYARLGFEYDIACICVSDMFMACFRRHLHISYIVSKEMFSNSVLRCIRTCAYRVGVAVRSPSTSALCRSGDGGVEVDCRPGMLLCALGSGLRRADLRGKRQFPRVSNQGYSRCAMRNISEHWDGLWIPFLFSSVSL
jgi:hypothetical protein